MNVKLQAFYTLSLDGNQFHFSAIIFPGNGSLYLVNRWILGPGAHLAAMVNNSFLPFRATNPGPTAHNGATLTDARNHVQN
jgi:hypothetical protein